MLFSNKWIELSSFSSYSGSSANCFAKEIHFEEHKCKVSQPTAVHKEPFEETPYASSKNGSPVMWSFRRELARATCEGCYSPISDRTVSGFIPHSGSSANCFTRKFI
ncbi:hypothetical protein AVEN_132300-1 [Araneus ventricosus]|uniref:Uncharacterized protein n=1 Tax=Araneus ventricosus TaxID=182803 RepID=A0A4Y2TB11_ARAVE|nr:hypothetical protein AVEN_132300-1 [Araneus ventricosus]